ncbi:MAG: glutathione S-transferase N-terminal domain-containing protein [Candidatus Binatia bacterium]
MKLYNVAYSGNSYKVRLLLAQLGIPCEIVEVDILKGESRTAEFLKINPNGRTPVLDDNGYILAESNAILAYLAHGTKYLPDDKKKFGQVFQWMFFEQYSHEPFIATSRFWLQHKPDSRKKPRCWPQNATAAGPRSKSWKTIWQRRTSSSANIPSPTSRCSPTLKSRMKAAFRWMILRRSDGRLSA